jgi:mannose-6-phosphate isomerase-like protein (cupin superfamily)
MGKEANVESVTRISRCVVLGVAAAIAFTTAASAQTGKQPAAPALYAGAAQLLASVSGGTAATNLTKGFRVARAGNDRVSIDVLKRTKPEEGPITHQTVTEIYQVLSGGGMLMTGGTLVNEKPARGPDGKPLNPDSIGPSLSGTQILDGQSRHVGAGDVVLIPPGTPHKVTQLDGQVTYMVVRYNPGWYAKH